ncbi:hypothetical protein M885DRAFT_511002 [Pelagophyceae sp. CCMP2097]|nr:hypothetical protein M885DRAFT_511002 [Pelagophyceae sp. CCMP2097]
MSGALPAHTASTGVLPTHSASTGVLPAHSASMDTLPAHSASTGALSTHGAFAGVLPAHSASMGALPALADLSVVAELPTLTLLDDCLADIYQSTTRSSRRRARAAPAARDAVVPAPHAARRGGDARAEAQRWAPLPAAVLLAAVLPAVPQGSPGAAAPRQLPAQQQPAAGVARGRGAPLATSVRQSPQVRQHMPALPTPQVDGAAQSPRAARDGARRDPSSDDSDLCPDGAALPDGAAPLGGEAYQRTTERYSVRIDAVPHVHDAALSDAANRAGAAAADVEKAFTADVEGWLAANAAAPTVQRERYADALTDRFLCALLDPLPATAAVSRARKRVARAIEALASSAPERLPSPQDWKCALCSKKNKHAAANCCVCKRPRPAPATAPIPAGAAAAPEGPEVLAARAADLARHGALARQNAAKAREFENLSGEINDVLSRIRGGGG